MGTAINAIAAVLIIYFIFKIYGSYKEIYVAHPLYEGEATCINQHMQFTIFSVYTAMVFLGPFSELKYIIWIATFIMLLVRSDFKTVWAGVMGLYALFLAWCCFALTYSQDTMQGALMLLKFILPVFYLWLGYNALTDEDSFIHFLKRSCVALAVYAVMLGGGMSKFATPVYAFLNWGTDGLFISYASLADFFSVMCVVPLAMYVLTSKKKYLVLYGLLMLSTVLDAVRTGIAGITLATAIFSFIKLRVRALPIIIGLFMGLMAIIFMVPEVREKMFGDNDRENVTLARENVQSNAREAIWDIHMSRFYEPSPVIGSGLGTSISYQKRNFELKLIHSDYVQMLCESGNIGVILFMIFFIFMMLSALTAAISYENQIVGLLGAMSVGSSGGMLFSMGFDNVVTYGQQCFIFPFLFYGMFLKAKALADNGELADNSMMIETQDDDICNNTSL